MRPILSRSGTLAAAPVVAFMVSLVTVFTTSLVVVLAVVPTPDASAVLVGLSVLLLAGVLGARYAAVALGAGRRSPGDRAEAHRHSLNHVPAPRHPRTAGRPSPRAPAGAVATA